MLCAGLNVMGFDWVASPACTELEVVTLDWLAQILHLPSAFLASAPGPGGGVIQGSAGESCIVVLLAAVLRQQRRWAEQGDYPSEHEEGGEHPCSRNEMVVYGSDQTHTIVKKACRILGVRYCALATTKDTSWGLTADRFLRLLEHAQHMRPAVRAAGREGVGGGVLGPTHTTAHTTPHTPLPPSFPQRPPCRGRRPRRWSHPDSCGCHDWHDVQLRTR